MAKTVIHTIYDGSAAEISDATAIDFSNEKSLTQQQFADECDINVIVDKYISTGNIDHLATLQPLYADVAEYPDFQTMLNLTIQGREAFESLPAKVRERFANDPQNLLNFVDDVDNREEAIKLGLIPVPKMAPEADLPPEAVKQPETAKAAPTGEPPVK